MNYQELYTQTIEKLKRHERPLIKLDTELIMELKTQWQKAIAGPSINQETLTKILCILDNTQNYTSELNDLFFQSLSKIREHEILVYILAASQKHIVSESLRTGVVIPTLYIDQLKQLLKNKNPEVLEWTLRTIESMGPLSLRLKKEVREINPSFLKSFNTHQKSATQIIELLENQWKRML